MTESKGAFFKRWYGLALATTHFATFFFWTGFGFPFRPIDGAMLRMLGPGGSPTCWPGGVTCSWLSSLSPLILSSLLLVYLITSVLTCALYLLNRDPDLALRLLTGLFFAKFGLLISHNLLIGNYHYITFFITLAFLFFRSPAQLIQLLLVLFYVIAGTLKLNREWLSGAALLTPLPAWINPIAQHALLVAAPVFELIIVFGLLSSRKGVRLASYGVTILFHLYSYSQVGFFYPFTMLALTSVFPLVWYDGPITVFKSSLENFCFGRLPKSHYLLLGALVLAWIYPKTYHGDSALTGQGRFLTLNMFDSTPVCYSKILAQNADGTSTEITDHSENFTVRVRCDPLRFFNLGQRLCALRPPAVKNISLYVIARRSSDTHFVKLVDLPDLCSSGANYKLLGSNEWIPGE